MNQPEATAAALAILRNPATFQWYVIPLLALVVYVYANEFNTVTGRAWRPASRCMSCIGSLRLSTR